MFSTRLQCAQWGRTSDAGRLCASGTGVWIEPLEDRRLFSSAGALSIALNHSATAQAARAEVGPAPSIIAQPANHAVRAGQTVHFTALATSTPSLVVQWQISTNRGKTFANITANSTANTVTLKLPHVAAAQNQTQYRAVFSNLFGSVTSNVATLTMASAGPISLASPAHAELPVVMGTATRLAALGALPAGGKGLTYTWSIVKSPGAALLPTFSANNTSAANHITATFYRAGSYRFRCTIRDLHGHAIATDVSVVVQPTPFRLYFRSLSQFVDIGTRTTYRADVYDQFRHALRPEPHIHYYIKSGDGYIDQYEGFFYAPYRPSDVAIGARALGLSDTIYVSVVDPNPVDLSSVSP